ncbi:MAG: hypothetical protein NT145_04425 [Elusimicrobia bacterium]|nr:hypothetical protein [Elusimicrobiota bacterium]
MKKILNEILDFFSDEENLEISRYDPLHLGAMIVIILFGMSLIFWLLWALLVFGGGIQSKVVPFLQILFTSKTAENFGYVGYPYEMGVFEGWITNVVTFCFLILVILGIWHVFKQAEETGK